MQKEIIDKIALLHIKNKKILMVKSYGREVFYTPGGKREGNETDIETLAREVKEELGVDLVPGSAKYYGTFCASADNKPPGVKVKIICYMADFKGEILPSGEVESLIWCDHNRCGQTGSCGQLIFDDLKVKGLIE